MKCESMPTITRIMISITALRKRNASKADNRQYRIVILDRMASPSSRTALRAGGRHGGTGTRADMLGWKVKQLGAVFLFSMPLNDEQQFIMLMIIGVPAIYLLVLAFFYVVLPLAIFGVIYLRCRRAAAIAVAREEEYDREETALLALVAEGNNAAVVELFKRNRRS
jgi:hypothetical protein